MMEITALIADDEVHIRSYILGILKQQGVGDVFTCDNGIEAVDIFRQHQPNLVFLDIHMPEKDGITVLEEIMAIDKHAFVVMVSGNSRMEFIKKSRDAGAASFIVKPISKVKVEQAIHAFNATG
jgi:two-component system, chemotaxis family, chemotaxis protein CheY